MKPRQRLQTLMKGDLPDCVPVAPDFSNMIPAKRTGKPFWDVYLYNDPPIWDAYIDCAKHFDIDALMDGYFPLTFPGATGSFTDNSAYDQEWPRYIVQKNEQRIVTQRARTRRDGKLEWAPTVDVYMVDETPASGTPEKMCLPNEPEAYELLEGVKPVDIGPEGFKRVKERMGDQGLVGVFLTHSTPFGDDEALLKYMMNMDDYVDMPAQRVKRMEERFEQIMAMDVKPDFLCVGGSGTLIFQASSPCRPSNAPRNLPPKLVYPRTSIPAAPKKNSSRLWRKKPNSPSSTPSKCRPWETATSRK
jgi:hypothetical protein